MFKNQHFIAALSTTILYLFYFLFLITLKDPQYVVGTFELDDSNESFQGQFDEMTKDMKIEPPEDIQKLKSFFHSKFGDEASLKDLVEMPDYEEGLFRTTTTDSLLPTTDEYRAVALDKINSYRKLHCAPALTINKWLNSQADEYAKHLLLKQQFIPQVDSQKLSENIYFKQFMEGIPPPSNMRSVIADGVDNWYHEVYEYNFDSPMNNFMNTLNFTNLVWKSTQNIGLGFVESQESLMMVAIFFPPGNIAGKFEQNVKPKDTSSKGGDDNDKNGGKKENEQDDVFKKMYAYSNLYY